MLLALCFGTRPQVVKASILLEVLRRRWQVVAVDTGQHYDFELNGLFYQQLGIPRPDHFLEVGSDAPAPQTAAVLTRTAETLKAYRPSAVIVIGDTNSTLGAALAASKEGYPLIHVEAGLRSSEPNLPEEINRRVVDVLSHLLCAPSTAAADCLRAERSPGIVTNTGDVARDVLLQHLQRSPAAQQSSPFILATFHRAALTADEAALGALVEALAKLDLPILLPLTSAHTWSARAFRPASALAPNRRCSTSARLSRDNRCRSRCGGGDYRLGRTTAGSVLVGHSLRDDSWRDRMDRDGDLRRQRAGAGEGRARQARRNRRASAPKGETEPLDA